MTATWADLDNDPQQLIHDCKLNCDANVKIKLIKLALLCLIKLNEAVRYEINDHF